MVVPLPLSYKHGDNVTLLAWNSTSNSWVDSGFFVRAEWPTNTTATIYDIMHLSIYALIIYNAFSFAKYELSTLTTMLNATSSSSWSRLCQKQVILDKIGIVCELLDGGDYSLAYDKLLHDIKPKLTGLKMDENGEPWGNGAFKHPWIVDLTLHTMLGSAIDAALADMDACKDQLRWVPP